MIQISNKPKTININDIQPCSDPFLNGAFIAFDTNESEFLIVPIKGLPVNSDEATLTVWGFISGLEQPPTIDDAYAWEDLGFDLDGSCPFPTLLRGKWFWAYPGKLVSYEQEDPTELVPTSHPSQCA